MCATRQLPHGQGRSHFALRVRPPGRRADRPQGGQLGLVHYRYRPRQQSRRTKKVDPSSPYSQSSESAESPPVAKSNGHSSVPDNRRACTAATKRIAVALPRRVPSCACACADTLPHFFGFGLRTSRLPCSLRRAHGANPPRTSAKSRLTTPMSLSQTPQIEHAASWMARAVWRWVKGRLREPARGDGKCHHQAPCYYLLWGARNESWIVLAACLRSARRAIAALHPKQAQDATPVTNTKQLKLAQCANGPGGKREKKNDVQPAALT